MQVSELIEKLKLFPAGAEVYVGHDDSNAEVLTGIDDERGSDSEPGVIVLRSREKAKGFDGRPLVAAEPSA